MFEAFRCCITDRKCLNRDCPYERVCNVCNTGNGYVQIPKLLALDVLNALKKAEPDRGDENDGCKV